MTQILERPPTTRPWWHIRPAERRPLALILGAGGPVGFAAGALLGIFLQIPGPGLPTAGQGPAPVSTSTAPPGTRTGPPPTRPRGTGSDAPARRAGAVDVTRPQPVAPTRHAPAPATTVTVTSTARTSTTATPATTPPTDLPPSGTPTGTAAE